MSTPPFVRFYGNDWFTGCAGLKADERGVYISMCVFIWTIGRRVPLDDAEAARMMGFHFANYQRIRDRLVVKGKVQQHADGYGVKRAEKELDIARNRVAPEPTAGNGRRSDQDASGRIADGTAEADRVRQAASSNAEVGRALLVDPIVDHAVDHVVHPIVDYGVNGEKTQCFLRANKEPEPELENKSVCVPREANALPVGFEFLGHGALINCETIRHPAFSISIVAVKMDLALQCPGLDARQVCSSAALQWAAEIEGGKAPRDVVPNNIRGAIVAGARMGHFRTLEHEVRTAKASKPAAARLDYSQAKAERAKELIRTLGVARHDA